MWLICMAAMFSAGFLTCFVMRVKVINEARAQGFGEGMKAAGQVAAQLADHYETTLSEPLDGQFLTGPDRAHVLRTLEWELVSRSKVS